MYIIIHSYIEYTIDCVIENILSRLQLSLSNCRGQTYDGASNMVWQKFVVVIQINNNSNVESIKKNVQHEYEGADLHYLQYVGLFVLIVSVE